MQCVTCVSDWCVCVQRREAAGLLLESDPNLAKLRRAASEKQVADASTGGNGKRKAGLLMGRGSLSAGKRRDGNDEEWSECSGSESHNSR